MANKSNVAKGTEYEQFVQSLYESVLRAEGVETVKVQHNILVRGRSGCEHQIDVYWEFRVAGQLYRTAIECKAFNQNVSVGRIRDFYGVLADVPGLTGIFATLVGYQSGAKKYAAHFGITLKELRAPTNDDWKGRAKDVHINIHVVSVNVTAFAPRATAAYLESLPKGHVLKLKLGFQSDEMIIFDQSGTPVFSRDSLRELLPYENEPAVGLKHSFSLPNHSFRAGELNLPIDAIDFTYNVDVETTPLVIRGDDLVNAIIRDVMSGEITVINKDGNVKTTT